MAAPAPAIEAEGLSRRHGDRLVLRDVSFTLPAGSTLAVLGANGAGKSTLLRVLATLLRPHGGTLRLLGADLPDEGWRIRGKIGLLGHEPLLYRDLSAQENLDYHARLHGVDLARVTEMLSAVGLVGRADDPVRTLSRGLVQRVAVCRAVLHAPEVLLLDEPHANLDPGAARAVEPLLGGATRVVTSHDPAEALRDADVALGLRAGRAAFAAPAADVGRSDLEALYPVSAVSAIVRKDLRLELRTGEIVPAMALFSVTTFVLFHFGLQKTTLAGAEAAGVLLVTLLLAAVLGTVRLFVSEREEGGLDGFLLAPVDRTAMLYAKAATLLVFVVAVEVVVVPVFALLLLGPTPSAITWLEVVGVLLGLDVGVAVIGTLVSALAVQGRSRELIVPIVGLPLLIPGLIAAARAVTPLLTLGAPGAVPGRWLAVLGLYDLVFALLAFAVFDYLLED